MRGSALQNIFAARALAAALVFSGCIPAIDDKSPSARTDHLLSEKLVKAEAELSGATTEYDRWLALTHLVLVEAGDRAPSTVRQHAEEALRLANQYRGDWNYGNAVHKANLALGRIALRENDLVAARRLLLEAGRTPGLPQLNTFGPNMLLAKELVARGERDALLEYFALCARFWEEHEDELRTWSEQVRQNVEPDFGANVLY